MRIRVNWMLIVAAIFVSIFTVTGGSAQVELASGAPQQRVFLSKLSPPIYPPLARVARVAGDVDLTLSIRQNGSIESARVVSGHPLLKQAALDSAMKSDFECHDCNEAVATYSLVYTFGLTTAESDTGVIQSQNHITILAEPVCICDPRAELNFKVRSAKCLYLWRCSLR